MKVYTFSQARQNLSEVLKRAKSEEVRIRRRGGDEFAIVPKSRKDSPFEIEGIKTDVSTADVLSAVRDVRRRKG